MTRRITTGAVLIAVLALFAGACSGGSDDAKSTTTTAKKSDKETTTTATDGTTAPVSDDEFNAAVEEVSVQIDSAKDDPCALLEVVTTMNDTQLPDPSTKAQVETAVGLLESMFTAIADSAPAANAAEAETIRTSMSDFAAKAKDNGYDPEWFGTGEADPFASQEATAALSTYFQATTTACMPAGTPTTAAP